MVLTFPIASWQQQNQAPVDPPFSAVKFGCHFEGADESTSFVDVKGAGISGYGNAKLSTSNPLMGGSSLMLDGDGDYLFTNFSFNWGVQDWTIDLFFQTSSTSDPQSIIERWTGSNFDSGSWLIRILGDGRIAVNQRESFAGNTSYFLVSSTGGFNDGLKHYLAVKKNTNTYSIWVDGVKVGEITTSFSPSINNGTIAIGTTSFPGLYQNWFNGKLDEIRITEASRDVSIVPTSPFPDS